MLKFPDNNASVEAKQIRKCTDRTTNLAKTVTTKETVNWATCVSLFSKTFVLIIIYGVTLFFCGSLMSLSVEVVVA